MSTKAIQCPKCNGDMVQGFIFDREDGGLRRVINWVEGAPGKDFLDCYESTRGKVRSSGYLPLFGVRLPGILCAPGICCHMTRLAGISKPAELRSD